MARDRSPAGTVASATTSPASSQMTTGTLAPSAVPSWFHTPRSVTRTSWAVSNSHPTERSAVLPPA